MIGRRPEAEAFYTRAGGKTLTFNAANWNLPQTVTVTGVDDFVVDGDQPFTIVLGNALSADGNYNGKTPAKVSATKGARPVGVALTTDCMVLWQQGQVDAIAADDAILAGLAAQDPSAKIVGDQSLESEPYGLGISKDHPEFVQYVNAVLDQMRSDGSWQRAYQASGLADILKDRTQPAADYTRRP